MGDSSSPAAAAAGVGPGTPLMERANVGVVAGWVGGWAGEGGKICILLETHFGAVKTELA